MSHYQTKFMDWPVILDRPASDPSSNELICGLDQLAILTVQSVRFL